MTRPSLTLVVMALALAGVAQARSTGRAPVPLAATPSGGGGTIKSSKHDFSARGWGSTEICVFCHTPHARGNAGTPLWNRGVSAATFAPYASPSLQAVVGQPQDESRACLSCHDGTIAVDSFGGRVGAHLIGADAQTGTDLRRDHPVSFTYDGALAAADGALAFPGPDAENLAPLRLFKGRMECSSCHQVHDPTHWPFLRISNEGSKLCLKCHRK